MELTEFLLARIAEDEAEVGPLSPGSRDEGAGPNGVGWAEVGAISDVLMVSHRRMLAECEAKRRIVELHEPVDYTGLGMESPNACSLCGADLGMSDWDWERDSFPCDTLKALASPYADHPEFREEWRP